MQGGREHWFDYYTSPQSFMITFSYQLPQQLWDILFNFGCLVHLVECPNISTTNCNLQKG